MDYANIEPFRVGTLTYACRDIGYGVEEDRVEAYWVNYIDPWGRVPLR